MLKTLNNFREDLNSMFNKNNITNVKEIYIVVDSLFDGDLKVVVVPTNTDCESVKCNFINDLTCVLDYVNDCGLNLVVEYGKEPSASVQYLDVYNNEPRLTLVEGLEIIRKEFYSADSECKIKVDLKNIDESSPVCISLCCDCEFELDVRMRSLLDFIRSKPELDLFYVVENDPSTIEEGWIEL